MQLALGDFFEQFEAAVELSHRVADATTRTMPLAQQHACPALAAYGADELCRGQRVVQGRTRGLEVADPKVELAQHRLRGGEVALVADQTPVRGGSGQRRLRGLVVADHVAEVAKVLLDDCQLARWSAQLEQAFGAFELLTRFGHASADGGADGAQAQRTALQKPMSVTSELVGAQQYLGGREPFLGRVEIAREARDLSQGDDGAHLHEHVAAAPAVLQGRFGGIVGSPGLARIHERLRLGQAKLCVGATNAFGKQSENAQRIRPAAQAQLLEDSAPHHFQRILRLAQLLTRADDADRVERLLGERARHAPGVRGSIGPSTPQAVAQGVPNQRVQTIASVVADNQERAALGDRTQRGRPGARTKQPLRCRGRDRFEHRQHFQELLLGLVETTQDLALDVVAQQRAVADAELARGAQQDARDPAFGLLVVGRISAHAPSAGPASPRL